ncbi:hypothetical protein MMC10_009323 [Thelotrema lepadinum]|nr:hypothetical protein [Thelotrema lepadinum]
MASSPPKEIVLAFDLYGTILSTSSIASELAKHVGEDKAAQVAATWRTLQLEYTWRLNSMAQYQPFPTLTHSSLLAALHTHSLSLPPSTIDVLLEAYSHLTPFPDVTPLLTSLSTPTQPSTKPSKSNFTFKPYIFSNGPSSSLRAAVHNAPSLAAHEHVFHDLVSVEETRAFKPAPAVYWHLLSRVGKKREEAGEVWLVSGNAFDVVGARSLGLRAVWVDREGSGWGDRLVPGEAGGPDLVVSGLGEVVGKVGGLVGREMGEGKGQ